MNKWVSAILSGVVGAVLAVLAAWGVVSSSTSAPSQNPAGQQTVQYGTK